MDHEPVLISTIAIGLTAAFVGGLIARRLRFPAIVGYIVAGIMLGPFTPGFVADAEVATELAEVGVILLMFGVGIHFSIRDLSAVKSIAIPGAIVQSAVATILGVVLGVALGWGVGGGLVLGLALSVASTVVLIRTLMDRGELGTQRGRIAVGWLIVEDIFTVVILVLLPSIAPLLGAHGAEDAASDVGPFAELGIALVKAGVFVSLVVAAGGRLVPRLLVHVARQGSRELFTLAVLAVAVGIAYLASALFGVSFALGAFLAGLIVSESDMSHQAAADALPFRDAFAVLFFVSVGMLLDPSYILANPLPVLAVVLLVVVAKSIAAFALVSVFGFPIRTGLTIAASLAQVGEFSFILGSAGRSLGLLPDAGFQLIVTGALLSIAVNPIAFRLIEPVESRLQRFGFLTRLTDRQGSREDGAVDGDIELRGHAILCGYGQVGRVIASALERRGFRYVVVALQRDELDRLRGRGVNAIYGDAANPEILEQARLALSRVVVVLSADAYDTRRIVDQVHRLEPRVPLVVRTHDDAEADRLAGLGGMVRPIYGEQELAAQMARLILRRFGVGGTEVEAVAQGLRYRVNEAIDADRRGRGAHP